MGYSTSPEGHQVCRQAWFHLMGVGKMRMERCKRTFHGQDKRMIGGHGGTLVYMWKGSNVLIWLSELPKPIVYPMYLLANDLNNITYSSQGLTAIQPRRPPSAKPSSFTSTGRQERLWPLRASAAGEPCHGLVNESIWVIYILMQPDAIVRDAPKSMLEANDDDMREDLFQRLIDAKLMGPTMQLSNTDPGNLPTRELPHGNVAELYMVFVAFCGNKTPASRACFYKEAKRWKQCLRFRRPLAHSLCKTCSQLQAALSNATEPGLHWNNLWFFWQGIVNKWFLCHLSYLWQPDWPIINQDFLQHAKIADRLLGHYCQQWKNRESYWLARSRAQQVGDLCCMMIDSYDKAKCMLPKFPRGRTPKQVIYESVKRIWSNFSLLFLTRILVLVVLLLWNGRVKVLPWLWLAAWFMDLACTSTWLMKDFLVGPTGQSK